MDSEETRLYYILWIAVLLLAVIIWFFIRVMTRNQANNLKALRQQLDDQVKKSDEDRLQIVGELHDDIGPYLSAIIHKLELIPYQPDKSADLLKEAAAISYRIMDKTRSLSRILMPYNVKSNSVKTAIRDFVNRLHSDDIIILLTGDEIPALKQDYLVAICRLIQEIVHNSIKHSNAGKLKIDLQYNRNVLTIRTAEHDWRRISRRENYMGPGIGRELMESRVRLLGGSMHTSMGGQSGIRYVIRIPLPNKIHVHEKTD